ncbi:FAD-dependent oxidoreductase [Iodobacter arcticus]|uniref:FAD-dependent oxidoreductase n=1 Tax=Iodobacter arcticus TaxID=590593 RepID=A0ABW2R0E3_9NEIS
MTQAPTRGRNQPLILSDQQGFDRRWFAPSLQAVYVPTQYEQVADCVGAALSEYGRDVKVTSGRHCYENFVYNDSTKAVIDMSALNQLGFDAERNSFYIDAGCENWSVYRTLLNGFGKTLPAGSCYSVGAGGHITGGGYGLLSRLHGLTVDHLSAVDIVTWDAAHGRAQLRHVSNQSSNQAERDLFWALQGAGCGNFGVIVRYYFATLPDAPEHATIWTVAWDWDQMTEANFARLLAEYADFVATMPLNDFSLLKLNHVSAKQIGLLLQIASPAGSTFHQHCQHAQARIQQVQQRFDRIAPTTVIRQPMGGHPGWMSVRPASADAQHLTYLEALQTLNGSGPNQFGKYKSAYMKAAFPEEQVAAIYHWLNYTPAGMKENDLAQSLLQVDSYGGAINELGSSATAVPQRSSIMKLQYQTYWNNAAFPGQSHLAQYREQEQLHLDWINGFYQAVYAEYGGTPNPANDPRGVVDGCYYNYPDSDLGTHTQGDVNQALELYFLDNFRKGQRNLVQVKQQWDPQNFFHHAQSIPVK